MPLEGIICFVNKEVIQFNVRGKFCYFTHETNRSTPQNPPITNMIIPHKTSPRKNSDRLKDNMHCINQNLTSPTQTIHCHDSMVTCDICCTCLMPSLMACGTRRNIKSNENFSKSLLVYWFIDTLSGRTQDNAIRRSSFFTPFSVVRPTQIFGVFKKKVTT